MPPKREVALEIREFNAGRLPEALPLKYAAMAESAFRFLRGSCHLFYADIFGGNALPASPHAWVCGDLHIENFGSYKGDNRLVYFDINDFDEGNLLPVMFDISRLLVSIRLAGKETGLEKKERDRLETLWIQTYRNRLIKGKPAIVEKETAEGWIKKLIDKVENRKEKSLLKKRTDPSSAHRRLLISEHLWALEETEKKVLMPEFEKWFSKKTGEKYQVLDVGFRIAGTGSIGLKRYLFLIEKTGHDPRKLLVDVKEATPAAASLYSRKRKNIFTTDAERVMKVQEMVQYMEPGFLSVFYINKTGFLVKELQPAEDKINVSEVKFNAGMMEKYIKALGSITASAHLRSSGRHGAATVDALKAFAGKEDWVQPLKAWVKNYVKQVETDHADFCKALEKGYFNT